MEQANFLYTILSLLILLIISSFTFILSKKINFPYTVLLVLVGLWLIPVSRTEMFSFINDFTLTPDILFYVLLPVLIFESAYNINYKQLLKNWVSIWTLSIIWLIISTFSIWFWLFLLFPFVWLQIPFLVCLLFWSLISATDPVAVLAIFKEIWAPRRLTLIFEWESLFNDWTAFALFLVVLWVLLEWKMWAWVIFGWVWMFLSMLFGWVLFWLLIWIIFSNIIWRIKNNEILEISLTIILANLTFVLSELISEHLFIWSINIKISWVIATTVAWIVLGNYGKYKITPKVEESMEKFWSFFAFISNSLVFILMWLILADLNLDYLDFTLPILVTIFVVMVSRAISVYLPVWVINFFKLEEKIPSSWTKLLSWWSLRWALAMMMVFLIPSEWQEWYEKILHFQESIGWQYHYSIKDFVLLLTICCIMFTLFIKATTISWITKKLWINKLHELEKIEYEEWKILADLQVLEKLNNSYEKWYVTKEEYEELTNKYNSDLAKARTKLKEMLKNNSKAEQLIQKTLALHALWIEKQYLKNLFLVNEIDEKSFKYMLSKIDRQIERVEQWKEQIRWDDNKKDIFEKIHDYTTKILYWDKDFTDEYIINRMKVIISRKVIKELEILMKIELWFNDKYYYEIIDMYKEFYTIAEEKRKELFEANKLAILKLEASLIDKTLTQTKEDVIEDLHKKEMITPKLYINFMEEIESEIYKDVRKI